MKILVIFVTFNIILTPLSEVSSKVVSPTILLKREIMGMNKRLRERYAQQLAKKIIKASKRFDVNPRSLVDFPPSSTIIAQIPLLFFIFVSHTEPL